MLEDYGALLLNPRRRRKKARRRRRSTARRRPTRRRRRRNPVLVTASNPRRRRRRRRPARRRYARRRRSYRRNPSGLMGRATSTLSQAGLFLIGDMAADVLTTFVWQKLGVGAWLGKQSWAMASPEIVVGVGRILIGLAAYPALKALRVPAKYAKAVSFGAVVSGGLVLTEPIKSKIRGSMGLHGVGDYMALPSVSPMGGYQTLPMPAMSGLGRWPTDAEVERDFYGHYN
jgi:hypothetical protein